jgi:hypothetical protein
MLLPVWGARCREAGFSAAARTWRVAPVIALALIHPESLLPGRLAEIDLLLVGEATGSRTRGRANSGAGADAQARHRAQCRTSTGAYTGAADGAFTGRGSTTKHRCKHGSADERSDFHGLVLAIRIVLASRRARLMPGSAKRAMLLNGQRVAGAKNYPRKKFPLPVQNLHTAS